jgi:hypothetical protein
MSKLTFSRTEKDFLNFSRIAARQYRRRGIIYIIAAVGIGIVLSLALIDILRAAGYFPADKLMQTAVAVGIYFFSFYLPLRFFHICGKQSWLDESGNFLSPKTFKMTAKGVAEESDHHKSVTDWRGVTDIQETKDYLLFYIDRMQAYLVPKAAFETPEDATAFLDSARGYWKKAGGGAVMKKGKK